MNPEGISFLSHNFFSACSETAWHPCSWNEF